jgi:hypothetical protein
MSTMKYTIGTPIPASEVLRRYKDEDDDIFLEVRGMEDVLFRVTAGDRVYYKIEKSKLKDEGLVLIVDYTKVRRDPEPESPYKTITRNKFNNSDIPTADRREIPFEEVKSGFFDSVMGDTGEKTAHSIAPESIALDQNNGKIKELQEGQVVPEFLRSRCKSNDHGGYSLRHEKFLYLVDKNYRVEVKTQDLGWDYDMVKESPAPPKKFAKQEAPVEIEFDLEVGVEFEPGDILPSHLRRQCEAEIGSNYGSRLILGDYLYLLDAYFTVTRKMKIAYVDETAAASAPAATNPGKRKAAEAGLPVEQVVNNMVKNFISALQKFNVNADYFKEAVLGPANREILIRAYNGDLSKLNDDTREALSQGKATVLKKEEAGFALFKAVLIHELYIKSTVAGRGNNMNYFLTYIEAARPDGTVGALQEDIPLEDQERIVEFFGERGDVYSDKTEIIKRIYRRVRRTIFEEYKELWLSKQDIRFNALLIARLYEHTTRLDRGDGLTMIQLTRDIIRYREQ